MAFQSIGTDIEIFAKTKDGHHKALCGLIGGSKFEPRQLEGLPPGYMFQEDNVSLEYNVPPSSRANDFINSIMLMNREIYHTLNSLGYEISHDSAVSFDTKELTHPTALTFGCEPDYNAWKMKENDKPVAKDPNLRTAGGHIHVGCNDDMVMGTQLMDLLLGVPSILLDNNESSKKRREMYGKAGAMRPKPYGWEYRVLSNWWTFKPENINWVFKQTVQSCHYLEAQTIKFTEKLTNEIQNCINKSDEKAANKLMNDFGIMAPMPLSKEQSFW